VKVVICWRWLALRQNDARRVPRNDDSARFARARGKLPASEKVAADAASSHAS